MIEIRKWGKNLFKSIFNGVVVWLLVIISIPVFLAANHWLLAGIHFWQKGVPLVAVIFLGAGITAHLIVVTWLVLMSLRLNRNIVNYISGEEVNEVEVVDLNPEKSLRQRILRAFWWTAARCGVKAPSGAIEKMHMLGMVGLGNEAMTVLYEIGGSITRTDEKNPCIEQGDTWDEETGQIVDIHQKYVGNIFKDRFIRGCENTDYYPKRESGFLKKEKDA